jgi:dihydroorotase
LSISTEGSIEQIRYAKQRGSTVTCSVSLANLIETDEALRGFDPNFKLRPPLRAQHHLDACLQGLQDGTVDVITSGHVPRAAEKKMREIDLAPFGAVGIETAAPLIVTRLIDTGKLQWPTVIEKLSCKPARLLGQRRKGSLRPGSDADITIIDPEAPVTIDVGSFRSKASNSPWQGTQCRGAVDTVIVGGNIKFRRRQPQEVR